MLGIFRQKVSDCFDTLTTLATNPTTLPIPSAMSSSFSTTATSRKRPWRESSHSPTSRFRPKTDAPATANGTDDPSSDQGSVELQSLTLTGRRRSAFVQTLQQPQNLGFDDEVELALPLLSPLPVPGAPRMKPAELSDDSGSEMSSPPPGMFPPLDDPKTPVLEGETEIWNVQEDAGEEDPEQMANGEAPGVDSEVEEDQPQLDTDRSASDQANHPLSASPSSQSQDDESEDFTLIIAGGSRLLPPPQHPRRYQYHYQHPQPQGETQTQTPNEAQPQTPSFEPPSPLPPPYQRRFHTYPPPPQTLGELTRARWSLQDPETRRRWRERRLGGCGARISHWLPSRGSSLIGKAGAVRRVDCVLTLLGFGLADTRQFCRGM